MKHKQACRMWRPRLQPNVALMAGMVGMWNADTHQALVEEIELFAGTPALRIFGVVSGVSIGSPVVQANPQTQTITPTATNVEVDTKIANVLQSANVLLGQF